MVIKLSYDGLSCWSLAMPIGMKLTRMKQHKIVNSLWLLYHILCLIMYYALKLLHGNT